MKKESDAQQYKGSNLRYNVLLTPPLNDNHTQESQLHPIPGSNRIFQNWTGNMQNSDIFAKKYRNQIENNACTRHLWKSRSSYLEVHPQIWYGRFRVLKLINMQFCQNPVECQPVQSHVQSSQWTLNISVLKHPI